jgi:glycosyltransferase involved in cell wall biosynthesis
MNSDIAHQGLERTNGGAKVKIAFVAHPFHGSPEICSTHIWVHEVARRLATEYSTVVYTGRQRSKPATESRDGVQYRRLSIPSETRWAGVIDKLPILWRLRGSISFRSSWYYCGHAFRIACDARAQHCDIVHILNLPQFAPIIRSLNPNAKIILHLEAQWLTGMNHSSVSRQLRSVHRVIGCSDFVTDQIRVRFPQFANRCATVYNGVDVERFLPKEHGEQSGGAKRLVYVGSIAAHKGVHVLLDALPTVLKRCPGTRLYLVGPPSALPLKWLPALAEPAATAKLLPFFEGKEGLSHLKYLSHLKEQISRLNVGDSVEFLGASPQRELPRWYRDADVSIFPTVCNDASPLAPAEAMSSGIPVVASRIGGLPEIVTHEETGLLVPPDNPAALASAIIRLLEDENLRRSMGEAGRKRALQNFAWGKIAQDLIQHCNVLTGGRNGF